MTEYRATVIDTQTKETTKVICMNHFFVKHKGKLVCGYCLMPYEKFKTKEND